MDDNILRKIKGCLALAQSNNSHEAASALRHAQALMEKYGISFADVAASDVTARLSQVASSKTPPEHLAMLVRMVGDAFGVEFVWTLRFALMGTGWRGVPEFYGVGAAPEIAAYAYDVLARQLCRDRSRYIAGLRKGLKRTTKGKRGDLYAQGWVAEASKKVMPRIKTEQEMQAIAIYKEQRWNGSLGTTKPRDASRKASVHDIGAVFAGIRDGKNVSFHDGVTGCDRAAIGHGE
ncbi:DUF7168 domain-containing protein [Desulfobulbus elongatus]|uniref:DUF7168 domain-containing protein n=1 Tax=Desulfobulbus elongatus TaxID=53332 RepID=UPI00048283E5|nr:DUF2786 domain-containing protein [Desulfobulbus elongatus]